MKKIKNAIRRIIDWLDPYHQSFLFLPWNFVLAIVLVALCIYLTVNWNTKWVDALRGGDLTYLPHHLIHEMLGHNFIGNICLRIFYPISPGLADWLHTLAGNGVEILIPSYLYFVTLRLRGGRWLAAPIFIGYL